MKGVQLSLVLPVHNQETIIRSVVEDIISVLESIPISFEIILVENGSTDNTLSVIKKMCQKDNRLKATTAPLGYGSAVLKGLSKARGKWVSYMPSDGQIDAKILISLVEEYKTGEYDLVKIYRKNRENFFRYFRSKIFNLIINLIFGKVPVKDINGSPRIFKRSALKKLNLTYTDSFIDTEFILKARYLKWQVKEIPMRYFARAGGKSTVRLATIVEFLKNIFYYRFTDKFKLWKANL